MMMLLSRRLSTALLLAVTLLAAARPATGHVLASTEESEVKVISNPHATTCDSSASEPTAASSSCDPVSFLLSPHRIIRTPMATQPDTLIEITTKKVLTVPVPVYHFRQSGRISSRELPFKIVLVTDIDSVSKNSLHAIPVEPAVAADSWFLGYSWSPVVFSGGCDGPVHVGWKFSRMSSMSEGGEDEFFYALIVDAKDKEKGAVRVGVGALGEAIADSLSIGTRAPAWMIDLLTNI